jgi:hypothetical protein
MTKLIMAFRSFAKAPKKIFLLRLELLQLQKQTRIQILTLSLYLHFLTLESGAKDFLSFLSL